MKAKENKILTIAGKRVRVVRGDGAIIDTDCSLCAFCRFDGNEYSCRFPNLKEPCAPYVTEDSYAYFVPAEDTIKGWVARDGHGALVFSNEKPSRLEWCGWKLWKISRGTPAVVLPNTFLPSLRWEDEPIEVEIIIKTK